ncbi:glycoside hydrolase family 3 N-terminal domain-containing protein [Streptacidiphilus cavernicola]|uniref:Glycoside hydrolase family 3 N-terminal domain-containing protein n=1 Tax=Streptacidiphilus cavernicola TaxID=3342716 RepID=A0ABV6VXD0_9ACTN
MPVHSGPEAHRRVGRLRLSLVGALLIGGLAAGCSPTPTTTTPSASPSSGSAAGSPSQSTGAASSAVPPSTSSGAGTPSSVVPKAPVPVPAPSRTVALSQEQLAGQRIIYSYPGLTPPAALLQRIREGEAAGVIFFGQNVSSEAQLRSAITQLRQAQAASPIHEPLLLMTDQEGGEIRRLPGAPTMSAKQIGATGNPAVAASAGTDAARNLAGVGMNLNLAPVLDVYHSAGDFADSAQRSFSSTPAVVASMGRAFLTAQQQAGVAATAKHFPGLGAAGRGQNTDLGPVTVNESLATLRGVDEAPYPAAIASGVKLIMLSWAVYPALDPARPAGMSPTIVQQELRTRLGFTGVTVTDALEAKALDSFGTMAQRAVAAAGAGMDLLLCSSQNVGQGETATTALVNALNSGALDATGFRAAADRVTALRAQLR